MWNNFASIKLLSPNLSKDEFQDIKCLNDNPHVLVLKTYKGNVMVSMNTVDYDSKMKILLSSSSHKILPKNLLNDISQLVTKAIKSSSMPAIQCKIIP